MFIRFRDKISVDDALISKMFSIIKKRLRT